MLRSVAAALLAQLIVLAGCTPYVNIPPQKGDLAFHSPNKQTVRDIMIVAARAAIADRPIEGTYQLKLPEGSSSLTYEAVVQALGGAGTYGDRAAGPMLSVEQVRIRGVSGEVDLVRPVAADRSEFLTAYASWAPNSGWAVDRVRVWRTFDPSRESPLGELAAPVLP